MKRGYPVFASLQLPGPFATLPKTVTASRVWMSMSLVMVVLSRGVIVPWVVEVAWSFDY